jgi:hypothetical protein
MTSIIKVDQIQKPDGTAPTAADLGFAIPYFQGRIPTANYPAQTQLTYTLNNFMTVNSAASLGADNQTVTINTAGVWKLDLTISCQSDSNASPRWQENYIYLNGGKIFDVRDHVINIDNSGEYYTLSGSLIYTLSSGDQLTLQANGQNTWQTNAAYYSNFNGIRLA